MADRADAQPPDATGDDTHANAAAGSNVASNFEQSDATVLTSGPAAIEADEFPQGLSPRELALTLKGQLLDHFHLQEFIGGGGMGAVFKALDTTLDRIVAVKVVASQSVSSEELQRRFLVEAQSTARLDHPNIARIHFVGRDRGLPYIVFEYINGVNLRDLVLNHGPVPVGDALSFTCQIAQALAHAWQKEVVHRDIKPSNILVTQDGQAKLVDMGLARLHQVDPVADDLTSTGVTLGTFDYISPEQARDPREADTRSDIYSLGCTLFYMLSGRPPFADGTAVQKLLQHQDQIPPNLSELRPEVPEAIAQLVRSMLAKSPEARPQTPSALVASCYEISRDLGIQLPQLLTPLSIAPQEVSPSRWQVHLPWAIPLAALLSIGSAWIASEPDSDGAADFPPLKRPVLEDVEAEGPDNSEASSIISASTTAIEAAQPGSAGAKPQESGSINVGAIIDLDAADVVQPSEPSILEFPIGESLQADSAVIESDEAIDVGGILLSE